MSGIQPPGFEVARQAYLAKKHGYSESKRSILHLKGVNVPAGDPPTPKTLTARPKGRTQQLVDVTGSKMTRERSLRLAGLGESERDLKFRVGGHEVYRVPTLLHTMLNYLIYNVVVKRQVLDVHKLMEYMPYRSFVQRKFFDELERQGFITSAAFRKFLPETNWMQGVTEVRMPSMGLGAPDLYILKFCLETVDYTLVDLRDNPLTGPAVVCVGPICGSRCVTTCHVPRPWALRQGVRGGSHVAGTPVVLVTDACER